MVLMTERLPAITVVTSPFHSLNVKMPISALLRLWHRVRTIQKKGYDLLEHFLPHIHLTVDAVAWLRPIHFAYRDLPRQGFSPIAELDVEQIPAQDHRHPMIRIAMPRGRLPWQQPLSPDQVISAMVQHLLFSCPFHWTFPAALPSVVLPCLLAF